MLVTTRGVQAASSSLEHSQNFFRQRRVEVVRNYERPSTEPERSRIGLLRRNGPQLGDRVVASDYEEMFPGLDPVQQGIRVTL